MSRGEQTYIYVVLQRKILNLRKLVYEISIALVGSTLLAIGAKTKLTLPFTHVPFTLQTLFLHYLLFTLGKKTWRCVLTYITLGLLGVPIFAFGGGFLYVLSPTFGYIVGFLIGTIAAGLFVPKGSISFKRGFVAGLIQLSIVYAIGSIWLASWYSLFRKTSFLRSIILALLTGIAPFVMWDFFKLLIALHLSKLTFTIRLLLKRIFNVFNW